MSTLQGSTGQRPADILHFTASSSSGTLRNRRQLGRKTTKKKKKRNRNRLPTHLSHNASPGRQLVRQRDRAHPPHHPRRRRRGEGSRPWFWSYSLLIPESRLQLANGYLHLQTTRVARADKTAPLPEYEKGAGLQGMNASGGQSQGLSSGPSRGQGGRKRQH